MYIFYKLKSLIMKKTIFFLAFAFMGLMMNAQHNITKNTTWDGNDPSNPPPTTITGDITINGSYYLIIKNCTIAMPSTSKIIVKRNAKLYIDNATIKAISGEWIGIRCDKETISGNDRVPYVNISNFSVITEAECAFMNSLDGLSNFGGAIVATDVDFKNNKVYLNLQNYNYNQRSWEYCKFARCKFHETVCHTGVYYIYLNNVENVSFRGCEFYYGCSSPRICIIADDSKFTINGYINYFYPHQIIKNVFTGFSTVINAQNNPQNIKTLTIANCIFNPISPTDANSDIYSIKLQRCDNPQIYSNTFNIYQGSNSGSLIVENKCAISLNDCYTFKVENNTINFTGLQQQTFGIIVYNSKDQSNQIYRNTINNATVGIQADGKNRGNSSNCNLPNHGLKFLCNNFNSFNTAYYMKTTNCNNSDPVFGVSKFQQGAINGEAASPNFNSLYQRTLTSGGEYDFKNEHIGSKDIIYVIPSDVNPGSFGITYHTNTIYPDPDPNTTISTPHCESRLPCFGINCPVSIGPSTIYPVFPQFNNVKSQLEDLVNAGDHGYLYDLVEDVSTDDLDDVYDALMESTPSHDIIALACENELFSSLMLRNILVENTYSIKSQPVRDALENRDDQLTQAMMDDIYEAAESISEYEDLMMQLDQMHMEYASLMNESLNALRNRDTIPMDSIKMYLEAYDNFLSIIKLIYLEFEDGNTSIAEDWFDYLQTITDDETELDDYNSLYSDVLLDVYSNLSGDYSNLTETQLSILSDMTSNGTYASGIAKYILSRYYDYDFTPTICPVESNSQRKGRIITSNNIQVLNVFPNPANNLITVQIPNDSLNSAYAEIFDISGKILIKQKLTSESLNIDVSLLSNGIYLIKVKTDNQNLTKLVVISK